MAERPSSPSALLESYITLSDSSLPPRSRPNHDALRSDLDEITKAMQSSSSPNAAYEEEYEEFNLTQNSRPSPYSRPRPTGSSDNHSHNHQSQQTLSNSYSQTPSSPQNYFTPASAPKSERKSSSSHRTSSTARDEYNEYKSGGRLINPKNKYTPPFTSHPNSHSHSRSHHQHHHSSPSFYSDTNSDGTADQEQERVEKYNYNLHPNSSPRYYESYPQRDIFDTLHPSPSSSSYYAMTPYSTLNSSSLSLTGTNTAVLSSLRALQDKIKLIEYDRNTALRQVSELQDISNRDIDNDSNFKMNEVRNSQVKRNKQVVEYEREMSVKVDMDKKVVKGLDKNNVIRIQIEGLRKVCEAGRRERDDAIRCYDEAGAEHERLEDELCGIQKEESSLTNLIHDEQEEARLEEISLKDEVETMIVELERMASARKEVEGQKYQVDKWCDVVLALNQELVENTSSHRRSKHHSAPVKVHRSGSTVFVEGGIKAAESAYHANLRMAVQRLLDGAGDVPLNEQLKETYEILVEDSTFEPKAEGGDDEAHDQVDSFNIGNNSGNGVGIDVAMAGFDARKKAESFDTLNSGGAFDVEQMRSRTEALSVRLVQEAISPSRKRLVPSGLGGPLEDLKVAIVSVEEEFRDLNKRYIDMLDVAKDGGIDSVQGLLNIITTLQHKGEQIALLKGSLKSIMTKPGKYSGDSKWRNHEALSILEDYREGRQ